MELVKIDESLLNISNRLQKEVNIFEELKENSRLSCPDGQPILRQHPPSSTIKNVSDTDKRLSKFYRLLQIKTTSNNPDIVNSSKKVIDYLDKYINI